MSSPQKRRGGGRRVPYTAMLDLTEAYIDKVMHLAGDDEDIQGHLLTIAIVALTNYRDDNYRRVDDDE